MGSQLHQSLTRLKEKFSGTDLRTNADLYVDSDTCLEMDKVKRASLQDPLQAGQKTNPLSDTKLPTNGYYEDHSKVATKYEQDPPARYSQRQSIPKPNGYGERRGTSPGHSYPPSPTPQRRETVTGAQSPNHGTAHSPNSQIAAENNTNPEDSKNSNDSNNTINSAWKSRDQTPNPYKDSNDEKATISSGDTL